MAAEDDFFAGQEIDEIMEELNRRRILNDGSEDPYATINRTPGARHVTGVGKFLVPKENTWAAHRALILDSRYGLGFAPDKYGYFDNVIHQKVDYDPVWNFNSGKYPAYDVLRENLAIVRNYIMTEFFPDGTVDSDDAKKVKQLEQVAKFITDGLNNDRMFPNPFKPRIRLSKANLPGTGAQYIYEKILKKQNYFSWIAPVTWVVNLVTFRSSASEWDLPPLEESPFSDSALRKPPPGAAKREISDDDIQALGEIMDRQSMKPQDVSVENMQQLDAAGDEFALATTTYASVGDLQEPTKRESVEIAKEILRKLKVKLGNALIAEGLQKAGISDNFAVLDALKGAVRVYEFNLHKVMQLDSNIMENPAVIAANEAIGKLGFIAKAEVLHMAKKLGDSQMVDMIQQQLAQMPKSWIPAEGERFASLLDKLESGLNTVLMRINQVEDKQTAAGSWLGFSNENTLGDRDPTLQKNEPSKAMTDDAYYKQYNAQRAARAQQASVTHAAKQSGKGNEAQHSGPNAAARKQSNLSVKKQETSLSSLVQKDQMANMRSSLKTDPNTEAVKVSRRQEIIRREKERSRRQTEQLKTVEQVKRANKRTDLRVDDHGPDDQQVKTPHHKKSDRSHGL